MAGETEVKAMLEASDKALKALLALLKFSGEAAKEIVETAENIKKDIVKIAGKINEKIISKDLLAQAKKGGAEVEIQSNIAKKDVPEIMERAKKYKLDLQVLDDENSKNKNVNIVFRKNEKAIFEKVLQEVAIEKVTKRPNELSSFQLKEWAVKPFQKELSENNITSNIVKNTDGTYSCIYENADKKAVEAVKENFKNKHKEVTENFNITKEKEYFVMVDKALGKQISFQSDTVLGMGEGEFIENLKEKFGYDDTKAQLAANKFAHGLTVAEQSKFLDNSVVRDLEAANAIIFEKENILLKEYAFYQIKMKGDIDRFVLTDKDGNAAVLDLNDKKCRENLERSGVNDEKTIDAIIEKRNVLQQYYGEKALENKALKVVGNNKKEIGTVEIERLDKDNFDVGFDGKKYNFSFSDEQYSLRTIEYMLLDGANGELTAQQAEKLAKNILEKAKSQPELKPITPEIKTPEFTVTREVGDKFIVKFGEIQKEYGLTTESVVQIQKDFNISEIKARELLEAAQKQNILEINRKINNNFEVKYGEIIKNYEFENENGDNFQNLIDRIKDDFNVSESKAREIYDCAAEQSFIEEELAIEAENAAFQAENEPDLPPIREFDDYDAPPENPHQYFEDYDIGDE